MKDSCAQATMDDILPNQVSMRIYLDVCCLNRPFDDLDQDRIRLEAEAVKAILRRIGEGQWKGVRSPVVDFEISQISDPDTLIEVGLIAIEMKEIVSLMESDRKRILELVGMGFKSIDAMHLACAEKGLVDVFLTTDDSILKRAAKYSDKLGVKVDNPLWWFNRVEHA